MDLKDYASKLLEEIENEIKSKTEQIVKLRSEVDQLNKDKAAIQQILATIEQLSNSPSQSGLKVKAEVELPKDNQKQASVDEQNLKPEAIKVEAPARKATVQPESGQNTIGERPVQPTQTVQAPEKKLLAKPFNGEKKWEPIVVNNTEYAAYSVSQSTIFLSFKFGVPTDSKYVRGFIIDKYLQKMREESSERVSKGEIKDSDAFNFEVKTNDKGEITEIRINNFAHDQLQDLLNKIKWFVASEVRDLRAKGRLN